MSKANSQPKLVVLVGSLRFWDKIQEMHEKLELAGNAVVGVTPHIMTRPYTVAEEALLDELHQSKIRRADTVFVVNVGGYVGSSTRKEIELAEKLSREIIYLEPPVRHSKAKR